MHDYVIVTGVPRSGTSMLMQTSQGAFIANCTVIFPLFYCYLTDKSRKTITDRVMNIEIEFKKIIN